MHRRIEAKAVGNFIATACDNRREGKAFLCAELDARMGPSRDLALPSSLDRDHSLPARRAFRAASFIQIEHKSRRALARSASCRDTKPTAISR